MPAAAQPLNRLHSSFSSTTPALEDTSGAEKDTVALLVSATRHCFSAGTVLSVPVRVHFLLPAVAVLLMVTSLFKSPAGLQFLLSVISSCILVLSVLLHELGHALVARQGGAHVLDIVLGPFGGFTSCCFKAPRDVWDMVKVSLAGPLTHVPMVMFWAVCLVIGQSPWYNFLRYPYAHSGILESQFHLAVFGSGLYINAWLLILNILPAYPLDGSWVFVSFLLCRYSVHHSALVVGVVALAVSVGLIVYSGVVQAWFVFCIAAWLFCEALVVLILRQRGTLASHALFARAFSADEVRQHMQAGGADMCTRCRLTISDNVWNVHTEAGQVQHYHRACLTCSTCGVYDTDQGLSAFEDVLYCREHYPYQERVVTQHQVLFHNVVVYESTVATSTPVTVHQGRPLRDGEHTQAYGSAAVV